MDRASRLVSRLPGSRNVALVENDNGGGPQLQFDDPAIRRSAGVERLGRALLVRNAAARPANGQKYGRDRKHEADEGRRDQRRNRRKQQEQAEPRFRQHAKRLLETKHQARSEIGLAKRLGHLRNSLRP